MPLDTAINIVSVDDAAEELGTPESGLIRLERLINAVSMRIERYTRNVFKQRSGVLTLDGPGSELLDLGGRIISVTSVVVGTTTLAATDYQILQERGQLYRAAGWGEPITNGMPGVRNVVVDVTRGYAIIPYDVQEAVYAVLRSWGAGSAGGGSSLLGGGFQSEKIGDYSYTRFAPGATGVAMTFGIPADLAESVASILAPYVRHGF